jgi:Ras-related protein Rab-22
VELKISGMAARDVRPREVKVVLLGDTGVGKSSLVLRFITNEFKPYVESTIGASFMSKLLMDPDGSAIKFQIWDTAGQEKYHSLAPMYYKGAAAAIVVYDITKRKTYDTLKDWIAELRAQGPQDIVLAIAGNKSDLEQERQVSREEAEEYARSINATFMETSAKTKSNVDEIFVNISKALPAYVPSQQPYNSLKLNAKNSRQSSCC